MNDNWMKTWEEVKDILTCPTDLETYFTSDEIAGQQLETMEIGNVSLPSGKVVVRDHWLLWMRINRLILFRLRKEISPLQLQW